MLNTDINSSPPSSITSNDEDSNIIMTHFLDRAQKGTSEEQQMVISTFIAAIVFC